MISDALILYPGLGLALSECKQVFQSAIPIIYMPVQTLKMTTILEENITFHYLYNNIAYPSHTWEYHSEFFTSEGEFNIRQIRNNCHRPKEL